MIGEISLNSLKQGEFATVKAIHSMGRIRRRLLDIGLIEGTDVECIQYSPAGELTAFRIRGAVIAIRKEDSENVLVIS